MRLWVRHATVKWIAAGTMSHSREAPRQGWIERHKERLSGNRALLSGHHRGPEWRIITDATRTLTSLTVYSSGASTLTTHPGSTRCSFSTLNPATFYSFSSTEMLFCLLAWWSSSIPLLFQIKAGCVSANVWEVQHSPYAEGGQLHFSQNLACLTLSFKRDGRDVRVLTSLHH